MSLFSDVPLQELAQFSATCSHSKKSAGQYIAYEGDEEVAGFVVFSGRVGLVKTSLNGRELIVETLLPGDPFGLVLALEKSFPLTARAQVASEVMLVSKSSLLQLLADFPLLYRKFVDDMSKRLREAYDISRALAHDSVDTRVASTLLNLVPRIATVGKEGHHEIKITRLELAGLCGMALETAVRVTKAMERSGILDLSRWGVIEVVNVEELENMASS